MAHGGCLPEWCFFVRRLQRQVQGIVLVTWLCLRADTTASDTTAADTAAPDSGESHPNPNQESP